MRSKTKHIDDVQPATVDEHFNVLLADKDPIDYETSEEMTPNELPEWYDEELFEAGQRYYSSNLLGISAATFAGLIAVFAIPSILKILIFTKQGGTPCAAFRRYLETLFHSFVWYTEDIKDKNSDWYKSVNEVRFRHSSANRRSIHAGLEGITHRDMALTQFGFIGYALLRPEYLGLTNTAKEREGLVHFWRVLGHMLGISDRLNVCRKNEAETTELCSKLSDQVFRKYFKEVPPNFVQMTEVMIEGMWNADMANDTDAVFAFAYKMNDLPYPKPLGLYSWLNLKYRETIHMLCGAPYIGKLVRVYFNYFIIANYWILRNFPIIAWLQYGKNKTKIQMYPRVK